MTKEEWEELFHCFEKSGLTQKAFCVAQGLEHKHFLYRWNARNRLKKTTKNCSSDFESISVISKSSSVVESELTLKIYLPNAIGCEVTLHRKEMQSFLKELVDVNS